MTALVTFSPVNPPGMGVGAILGDGKATPSGGGGWDVVARPRRKGFTFWNGYAPYTMSIPILLDGFVTDESVEADIERLRRMMRVPDPERGHPPIIRIFGPVPLTQLLWVITNITPGDELRRPDGQRTRAFMTIELLEYVDADVLTSSKPSPAAVARATPPPPASSGPQRPPATPAGRTYTVKRGDTLWGISVRLLGNGMRWHEIADSNGVRDPRALQIGTVLRIP